MKGARAETGGTSDFGLVDEGSEHLPLPRGAAGGWWGSVSRFLGPDTARLALAHGVAQLVPALVSPILTRLYSPAEYGVFANFASAVGILGALSCFRLELAVPITRSARIARGLMLASSVCALLMTLMVLGVVVALRSSAWWTSGGRLDSPLLWLLPFSVLLCGLGSILSYVGLRLSAIRSLARARLSQGFAGPGAQVGFGLTFNGILGLIVGDVVSRLVNVLFLTGLLRHFWRTNQFRRPMLDALAAFRRYRGFVARLVPAAALNLASVYLPVVVIAAIYGHDSAGWFSLSQRLLTAPLLFVSTAISQVFQSEFSAVVRGGAGDLSACYWSAARRLAVLAALPLTVAATLSGWIVPWLFGEPWAPAAQIIQRLSPMLFIGFVASPLSSVLITLEKTAWQLSWDVCRASALVVLFLMAMGADWPLMTTVSAYSAVLFVAYVVLLVLCHVAIARQKHGPSRA